MPDLIVSQKVDDFMRTATAAAMRAVLEAVQLNGALGTPTSGVATNLTGTAAGLTAGTASAVAVGGITGLGTGVAAALAVANGAAGGYATINGAAALTNKTYNGLTVTTTTGTFTLAAAKVLTVSNTLTFTGTDGSSVAFGTGGTVLYSGGAYAASITGTANQIAASAATGAVTLSIPSTFIAPGSIATTTTLLVGNGTAGTALSALTVYDTGTTLPRGISNVQVNSGTDSANFSAYKARGAVGALTTIVTGDILGNFRAWGYDGANYLNSGALFWTSEGTIAATRVPTKLTLQVATDAAPSVLTTTAVFSGTTGIALTALGTNQSITLTPSGTGMVAIPAGTRLSFNGSTNTTYIFENSLVFLDFYARVSSGHRFYVNGSTLAAQLSANAHLLLGGLTADGTGVLQFPAATTNTGGITFGADTFLYRTAARTMFLEGAGTTDLNISNSTGSVRLLLEASATGSIATTTAVALNLAYNNTTVLSLTSATNATFIGTITKPGGTSPIITTNTAITSGAGVGVGTLTNAPASTNPTSWIPINDNGTTRYIPAW